MATVWGVAPKESIGAEVRRAGRSAVAARCVAVFEGRELDEPFLFVLAGPASRPVLEGMAGGLDGYWPRVWALRGLRYAWDDLAARLVIDATADDSWRVREMAAKVIGAHEVDDGLEALSRLAEDPVPRVRKAATSARAVLARAGVRTGVPGPGVRPGVVVERSESALSRRP
ncbi:MAG: HEAT repeat domain-containing protein [Acidimicrobiales bacterium]